MSPPPPDSDHAQGLWEQDHTKPGGFWSVEAVSWMEGRHHESKHDSRKPKHSAPLRVLEAPGGKDHPHWVINCLQENSTGGY